MKKIISGILIVTLLTFSLFPTDKFERIANKTCKSVTGKELGLSTGEKIGIGAGLLIGGALLYNALKGDKYDDIADKAYEKIINKR